MIDELKKLYDHLFERAESIAKDGEEHQPMIFTFKPTAKGYVAHGIVQISGDKDVIATALSAVVRNAPQMWVSVHIVEAWMKMFGKDENPDTSQTLAGKPGAHEAVVFTFFCEGRVWLATCNVDHKRHTLTKGPLEEVTGNVAGRFVPEPRRT